MRRVEKLEEVVQAWTPEELAEFRAWFTEYDRALWDQQLERDIKAGKLDQLADEALREHSEGKPSLFEAHGASGSATGLGPTRFAVRLMPHSSA